jgi:hypothetical protein
MAYIDLTFSSGNNFIQIGDYVKHVGVTTANGFTSTPTSGTETNIGQVSNIVFNDDGSMVITVNVADDFSAPPNTDFIYFVKNSNIEKSSVSGYFADINFQNNSTEAAELFSVGCEISPSSK